MRKFSGSEFLERLYSSYIFYTLSSRTGASCGGVHHSTGDSTSSFSHYIICFYFLSSVTARQPIRIIKTTFKQFAARFLIFLAWSLFPMHRCGMSSREHGPDSISLLLFIWGGNLGIGSQVVMELLPNLFILVSVTQTNMCSATVGLNFKAVTACQHSGSAVINHHPVHLIRMQQTSTVSCDGRTMGGWVRSCSINWVSAANGHLDVG